MTIRVESVAQIEALPVGSRIDDRYHGYHVHYTKNAEGTWDVLPLEAPSDYQLQSVQQGAAFYAATGGFPTEKFQLGIDAGANLTILEDETENAA